MGLHSKRIGVVLAGCGYLDGTEIHEATLTLLALDQRGAQIIAMAPDMAQRDVVNHHTGTAQVDGDRQVFAEAARIARGDIQRMESVQATQLDALIFPGGFGAAKNLSSFAVDGPRMTVLEDVSRLIRECFAAQKPMGFICISPTLAAKVLGEWKPRLTIGNDPEAAAALNALGAEHLECPVDAVVTDTTHRIVSTPAYMLGPSIAPVFQGIDRLVDTIDRWLA
jgi:enhancing lycopene biosynthesis protein 2